MRQKFVPVQNPLADAVADFSAWQASHGYAPKSVATQARYLYYLCAFLDAQGIVEPTQVTFASLESYQRHMFHHRKANGEPLSFNTQLQRAIPIKSFFAWLVRQGRLTSDPAWGIVLPRKERRRPKATLTVAEMEALLTVPNTTAPLGLRNRAMLEVFYSSAIRRAELIKLRCDDVDYERGTLFIDQGKGHQDRHVPIGPRALTWTRRYVDEVRPRLVHSFDRGTLFLSTNGTPVCADWLTRSVRTWLAASVPDKPGSCHLIRHSAATQMLEGGADLRYVQELLGHVKIDSTTVYTNFRELHQTRVKLQVAC